MDLGSIYAEYEPALLLGIGGTGVRVLRLILQHGESGEDPRLKAAIREGRLKMLAIDTDASSNKEENDTDSPAVNDFLLIESRGIWRAIKGMLQGQYREGVVDIDDVHRAAYHDAVRQIMPELSPHAKHSLSPGQADEQGARQNRLLGRIALFSAAGDVYQRIGEALSDARRHRHANERLRVYVICSLAGGTGCGMMLDVALLTRMQEETANLFATLLLPGAFGDPNRNGETYVNTYAALKELSVLKNWQIPSSEFTVMYPEELGRNRNYTVQRGAPSLFKQIFLYDDLGRTDSEQIDEVNRSERIEAACHRMSYNILAQLRTDVRGVINIGMNNENGDAAQLRGDPRSRYAFSTSATATFPIMSIDDMARAVICFRAQNIARSIKPDARELGSDKLIKLLKFPSKVNEVGAEPFSQLYDALMNDMPTDLELEKDWVVRQDDAVAKLRRSLQALKTVSGPEFLDHADQAGISVHARDAIQRTIIEAVPNWSTLTDDAARAQLTPDEFYGEAIDGKIEEFHASFNEVAKVLEKDNKVINQRRLREWSADLESLITRIGQVPSDTTMSAENSPQDHSTDHMIPIGIPPSLVKMRLYLGWVATDGDTEQPSTTEPQPERILKLLAEAFCDEYGRSVKAIDTHFKQHENTEAFWHKTVVFKLQRGLKILEVSLDALKKTSDRQRRILDGLTTRTRSRAREYLAEQDYDRMLVRTEESLDPMAEEIGALLAIIDPDKQDSDIPLTELTNRLNSVLTSPTMDEPGISETVVREALGKFQASFEDEIDDVGNKVCKALCTVFDHLVNPEDYFTADEMIDNPSSFAKGEIKRRIEHYLKIAGQLLLYFVRQQPFFIARLGREEGIRSALKRCASSVFVGNRIERSIQRKSLIICRPNVELPHRNDMVRRQMGGDHHSLIRRLAQEILRDTGDYPKNRTDMPLVYFEQRYHGALEIARIDTYYRAYMATPLDERKLYHLFPEAISFDELIDRHISEEFLRPSFWRCGLTGHQRRQIPLDRDLCPACVEEYLAHRRPLKKVSRQDPTNDFVVPDHRDPDRVAFRIPGSMIEKYFWDGIQTGKEDEFREEFDLRSLMGDFN